MCSVFWSGDTETILNISDDDTNALLWDQISKMFSCNVKRCISQYIIYKYVQEKCSRYWPEKGKPQTWGSFVVESISEEKFADYVIRQFTLKNEVSYLNKWDLQVINCLFAQMVSYMCDFVTIGKSFLVSLR